MSKAARRSVAIPNSAVGLGVGILLIVGLAFSGCIPGGATIDLTSGIERWNGEQLGETSPRNAGHVILYSGSTCTRSAVMRFNLEREQIEFTEYLIDRDERRRQEMWRKLREAGISGEVPLPVLDVDGRILTNPRFAEIRRLVGNESDDADPPAAVAFGSPSQLELELHRLINAYRAEHGLPAIRLSRSLSHVARLHARDSQQHPPSFPCNMHSWSASGPWTACCYTSVHAKAACMWTKPGELSNYSGNGFEISYRSSIGATPQGALSSWQGSPGHNRVILNLGNWSNHRWVSVGVGMHRNYAHVWFGDELDPDGYWE